MISPSGPHRTVRESLDSYGSSCSTTQSQVPVHKQPGLPLMQFPHELFALSVAAGELFEFLSGPSDQHEIKQLLNAVESLPAKMTIVIDPSDDNRIKRTGNIFERPLHNDLEFPCLARLSIIL